MICSCEVCVLKEQLAALRLAAWDVHEVIGDWMDGNADGDDVRKVWNELGELLPATRPEVKP